MPEIIRTLIDPREASEPSVLPEDLRLFYGGDLRFPPSGPRRPYVIGNFVSTVDGVVSYEIPGKPGGVDISGFDESDRFIIGFSVPPQTPSWWDPVRFTRPPRSINAETSHHVAVRV